MTEMLNPATLTSAELYRLQSDTWGQGYDAGSGMILKAVATAEFLATNRERERIIKLLEEEHPCPLKGSHHSLGVCSCLVIALIKGENK